MFLKRGRKSSTCYVLQFSPPHNGLYVSFSLVFCRMAYGIFPDVYFHIQVRNVSIRYDTQEGSDLKELRFGVGFFIFKTNSFEYAAYASVEHSLRVKMITSHVTHVARRMLSITYIMHEKLVGSKVDQVRGETLLIN